MAWFAEAQARFSEYAGISLGSCGSRLTSRATFGTSGEGTTWPKMTSSTSVPSRFVRSISSRAAYRARSTARASFSDVPALVNGVRTPATTATRRPLRPGIRFFPLPGSRNLPPAPSGGELEQTRAAALASMVETPVDVLIIGGGITGVGIARDAALRGFRTALIDKADFGAGTSSHSSRLIHGGIRYLEQGALRLVFEASHERRVLLRIAPHLVRPLAFLFPVYRGSRIPAWKLRAGMWLYDLLSVFRNVRAHRWLRPKKVRRVEPSLRERGLVGAALDYDAQTDDSRLVLATARSAARAGALVANYVEMSSLLKPDGRVRGAVARDVLTGGESFTIRAHVVVNATGP